MNCDLCEEEEAVETQRGKMWTETALCAECTKAWGVCWNCEEPELLADLESVEVYITRGKPFEFKPICADCCEPNDDEPDC